MLDFALFAVVAIALLVLTIMKAGRRVVLFYPPHVGLLYRNGRFIRVLEPGRHLFWGPTRQFHVTLVARVPQRVAINEISVVSKDQFSFRISLSPLLEVRDPRAFSESLTVVDPSRNAPSFASIGSHSALHPVVSAGAIRAAGSHSLREIFADPSLITDGVREALEGAIPGVTVGEVLMTSITLPPETRRMFTEVERSKIEAEVSLERARGEQAALRALANAARLVNDNPALANLRFLQTLENAPGPKTIVVGASAVSLVEPASPTPHRNS